MDSESDGYDLQCFQYASRGRLSETCPGEALSPRKTRIPKAPRKLCMLYGLAYIDVGGRGEHADLWGLRT